MPAPSTTIDIESEAFALRLANLLRATRTERKTSMRGLAKSSDGRFTREDLTAIEEASTALDEELVTAVSALYGADLGTILPTRLPVSITGHVISAGGVEASFTPKNSTSLLTAYLRLIRTMRRQKKAPMIALRREDIEVLAEFLDEPGETIVDRLTALMGATLNQRTAMASMFATGAIVIGLAGATAASAPETPGSSASSADQAIEITVPMPSTPSASTVITVDVPAEPATTVATADEIEAVQDAGHDIDDETTDTDTDADADVATVDAGTGVDTVVETDATVPPATGSVAVVTSTPGASDGVATSDEAAPNPTQAPGSDSAPVGEPVAEPVAEPVVDLSTGIDATPMPDDDLTWLDGEPGTEIPTSAVITGSGMPTDAATTTPPVVAVVPPAVAPPDLATGAPPVPTTASSFAASGVVAEAATRSVAAAPTMDNSGKSARAEAKRIAQRERQAHRHAKRTAAALHRIESRASNAIERATNRIYIEADEERVAALQVISARAETALATAARQLFVHGGGSRAQEMFESVREEVYARADADKDEVLDVIYTRAHAEKTAITQRILAQAAQARADLGIT